jgi:hypothetical protein
MTLDQLRAIVCFIGEETLGYKRNNIETHSIRSGSAMAMYLAGIPVFTIMLIRHWSSDAFLHYICHQVQQFSFGVSNRMISSPDFFTIPDFASQEDPRTSGHVGNFAAHSNINPDSQRVAQ